MTVIVSTAKVLNTELETNVETHQPDYSIIHKSKRKKKGRKKRNICSVREEYRIKENGVDNGRTKLSLYFKLRGYTYTRKIFTNWV
jgi:hypothetical protein